jgi:hypothetical protein
MKGDFSRTTFDAARHYSQVLLQQGRVLLDADFNEASAVLLHRVRCLTRDIFGAHGGPADAGFHIELAPGRAGTRLDLSAGRYYVGGHLCENESCTDYLQQPHHSVPPNDAFRRWLKAPDSESRFLVYLDVWERWISSIDDPGLSDPALSGADTCGRSQVIWQAKAVRWDAQRWGRPLGNFARAIESLRGTPRGRLAVRLAPGTAEQGVGGRYLGAENALYRIEVHGAGAPGKATFKWSSNNASTAARWLGTEAAGDAYRVMVDRPALFSSGDWIELSHQALELAGEPGALARVRERGDGWIRVAVAPGQQARMAWRDDWIAATARRWRSGAPDETAEQGAATIKAQAASTTWIDIEHGLQVAFEAGATYRSGDYWLIPARTATASLLWPPSSAATTFWPAHGVEHCIAPLGLVGYQRGAVRLLRDARDLRAS